MRPQPSEYPSYYEPYIQRVQETDLLEALQRARVQIEQVLPLLPESKADYRYAEGKWTVKEKLQHVIDTERIMAYRALTIARGDTTPLPGFDEGSYAITADVAHRTIKDLATELIAVRDTTLYLFKNFNETDISRMGQANKNPVSVRGLAYIIAGHQRHHVAILQERYFPDLQLLAV